MADFDGGESMPQTRRSSTTTGSAVAAESYTEQTGPIPGGRQRSKNNASSEGNKDGKVETAGRTRRQVATDRQAVTLQSMGKHQVQSNETLKDSASATGKKQSVEQKRGADDNNRKREAEVLSDGTAKKVKLASTVKDSSKMLEIVSPRRSSRILVPNRRYKDMEDLTTSKSRKSEATGKDRKSVKEKPKFATGIKLSETESESEDIVTEEIPIDTSQAMDVMASSNNEISVGNTETVDAETASYDEIMVDITKAADNLENSSTEVKVDKSQTADGVKSEATGSSDSEEQPKSGSVDRLVTVDASQIREIKDQGAGINYSSFKPTTPSKYEIVHPKVVVVDPLSDEIIYNSVAKPEWKKAGAREVASKVKGRLLEIHTSSLKKISSGQVVHVPTIRTVNSDRNKHFEKREIAKDTTEKGKVKNIGNKDNVQETMPDIETEENKTDSGLKAQNENNKGVENGGRNETDICSGSEDGNNEEKNEDKLLDTDSGELSAAMAKDIITGVKVLDKYHDVLQSKGVEDESSDTYLAQTISTALGRTVEIIKVPLETKPDMEEENTVASRSCTDEEKVNSSETRADMISNRQMNGSETLTQESETEIVSGIILTDSVYTDVELGKTEVSEITSPGKKNDNVEYVNIAADIAEPFTVEVRDKVEICDKARLVNYNTNESNVDNISQNDLAKTSVQTSFCEVIEYDGKRKAALPQPVPPQSSFDYIMFGDNLIEIRKPQPLHGRIQHSKQEDTEPNAENVEFVVINEPKPSKTSTSSGSQDSLSTLTKVGQSLSPVKVITPVSSLKQLPRATQSKTHGHIIRADPTAPSTDVVEISEDVFQRELCSGNVAVESDRGKPAVDIAQQEQNTEESTTARDSNNSVVIADQFEENKIVSVMSGSEADSDEPISAKPSQTECILEEQFSKSETYQKVKQSRMFGAGAKIIVVGKEYLKEKGLEYEIGPVRTKPITAKIREATSDTSGDENGLSPDKDTSLSNTTDSFLTEDGDRIVIVNPVKDKPTYSEGKLATAGTQTPVATNAISRSQSVENTVIHAELKTVTKTVEDGESEKQETEQFIIVHLPEGTEIKQREVKKPVNYQQYNETEITMLEDGQFVCVDCHYVTSKRSNWFKHRRKHLGIKPHECPFCSYKAGTSSNLKRHIAIHRDIRNFLCPICSMAFRQKIHLERHLKYRHEEKKVKCPLCEYTCANENPDLKIHIKRRHMPLPDGSVLPFTCDECGIMTVSKKDLRQHKKFHKKGPELKLFCEFCSFVTDCESRLKRHMYIHTKEKPFQCGLCSYRATQKEHVLRHMKSQHDIEVMKKKKSLLYKKEEKENDDDTDSSESDTDNKNPFEQADYSSTDRIFACNHCTMRFAKLINLYKHLYSQHKSLMPDPSSSDFQCVVCEFRTNNKKNLLVHMRKHNMQDQTPPSHVYSCVLCRYINPRRKNLFQHMKKKHGIEIMVKDDGTTNCLISTDSSPVVFGREEEDPNLIPLSNIVSTHTLDENTLQVVSDDGASNSIQIITDDKTKSPANVSIENVINIEDIGSYVANSSTQDIQIVSDVSPITAANFSCQTAFQASIAEHEAAEAIEGLQALAEQAGLLETQTIETVDDSDLIAGGIVETAEIITERDMMSSDAQEVTSQQEVMSVPPEGELDDRIQLSTDQISQLSSGDYVEINGEVYKVEISSDTPVLVK